MDKQIFRGARELAAYTGFSENAIHILVARGALPVHRHGRLLIFLKDEIDEFFARLPGTTAADALAAATRKHDTTAPQSRRMQARAERLGPGTDEVSRPHRN